MIYLDPNIKVCLSALLNLASFFEKLILVGIVETETVATRTMIIIIIIIIIIINHSEILNVCALSICEIISPRHFRYTEHWWW